MTVSFEMYGFQRPVAATAFQKVVRGKIGGQLGSRWQSFISRHPFSPPAKVNLS